MKKLYTILAILLVMLGINFNAKAQPVSTGSTYSFKSLAMQHITKTSHPKPKIPKEVGDTSFLIFGECSLPFKTFFVNGPEYDNIFNPNPTGMYLNGKRFYFYCNLEKSYRQNISNFLEVYEFEYVGKKYLLLENFREDCAGEGCRYRCYNLFDISNPNRIKQVSFSSIYDGSETFGDFNNDAYLDFLRATPKAPKKGPDNKDHYMITAYTISKGRPVQHKNSDKEAMYIFAQGQEDVSNFKVLQSYWFKGKTLVDSTGAASVPVPYFPPYISFDPFYKHLYDVQGVRVEKKKYGVKVGEFSDLDAAKAFCDELAGKGVPDSYIMIDQYNRTITFELIVGNYTSKDGALEREKELKTVNKIGVSTIIRNLNADY